MNLSTLIIRNKLKNCWIRYDPLNIPVNDHYEPVDFQNQR